VYPSVRGYAGATTYTGRANDVSSTSQPVNIRLHGLPESSSGGGTDTFPAIARPYDLAGLPPANFG